MARRKKSARSVDGDNSENSNVRLKLIEGRNLMKHRKSTESLEYIYLCKLAEMGGSQT